MELDEAHETAALRQDDPSDKLLATSPRFQ